MNSFLEWNVETNRRQSHKEFITDGLRFGSELSLNKRVWYFTILFGPYERRLHLITALSALDIFSSDLTHEQWGMVEKHLKDAESFHGYPIKVILRNISNTLYTITQWLQLDIAYIDLKAQYMQYRDCVEDAEWRVHFGDYYVKRGDALWCLKCNVPINKATTVEKQSKVFKQHEGGSRHQGNS